MSLHFEEQSDGFLVRRSENGPEVARVHTRQVAPTLPGEVHPMSSEEFEKRRAAVGAEQALKERDDSNKPNQFGATKFTALSLEECSVRSCGGSLSVTDLQEILDHVKANVSTTPVER